MFVTDLRGQPVVVSSLDADWLLALVEDTEVRDREAARAKLRLAVRWCELHPATAETGVASWGETRLPELEKDESLGGEGTPLVAAFSPEPFAAALGVSPLSGMAMLADALDLVHRLPGIWARVETLAIPAWKARRVAQATHALSLAAATYVDAHLADRIEACGSGTVERVVAMAIAKFHPEMLAKREKNGRAGWHVKVSHPRAGEFAGTSFLEASGDSLDLAKFYDLVCDQASAMAALGDTEPLEVHKAKALGVIADQQATLDLLTLTGQGDGADGDSRGASAPVRGAGPLPRSSARKIFYLHASLTDLLRLDDAGVGEVERLGPATLAKIRDWVGHSRVSIRPVLDLARLDAVDAHDPPPWLRELVILRDRHCVFPRCTRDARGCDLDHIEAYDEHGPPGQTRPENLAPLCRRHHRPKTAGRWRYRREPDGTYTWTGPLGHSYAVTPHGTITLHPN